MSIKLSDDALGQFLPAVCRAGRMLVGFSQQELADAADISRQTVVDFERGARHPYRDNLFAMGAALEKAGVIFVEADERGGPGVRLRILEEADPQYYVVTAPMGVRLPRGTVLWLDADQLRRRAPFVRLVRDPGADIGELAKAIGEARLVVSLQRDIDFKFAETIGLLEAPPKTLLTKIAAAGSPEASTAIEEEIRRLERGRAINRARTK